jgi:hypothetical protein
MIKSSNSFLDTFFVCARVHVPSLLLHACWCVYTVRREISTSPHWHLIFSFLFSGDHTAMGLRGYYVDRVHQPRKTDIIILFGTTLRMAKLFTDLSDKNAASILCVKHPPEKKLSPWRVRQYTPRNIWTDGTMTKKFTIWATTAWRPEHKYNNNSR